jgi:hypothetical protein
MRLNHNWPAWALNWDINCIRLYRSCYVDPFKYGTWVLARDTMVHVHVHTLYTGYF